MSLFVNMLSFPHCRLLAVFFIFVVMGVIGEYAGEARHSITLILVVAFFIGLASFFYSKWIEQGGIRQGAELVRKMIDMDVNPRYKDSPFQIRWTVSVRCLPSNLISEAPTAYSASTIRRKQKPL